MKNNPLILFFSILSVISLFCYVPMIKTHSISIFNGWLVVIIMWSPGIAALTTSLIFKNNLRNLGLLPGKISFLLLGYFIPIVYATITYCMVWGSGFGGVPNPDFMTALAKKYPNTSEFTSLSKYILDIMIFSFYPPFIRALGEEIGWRGYLVPELAKRMTYTKLSLFIGLIWAAWHYPAIIWTNYNIGAPVLWALSCFTIMIIAISFIMTWLRTQSKSIWPCVLFHSSHNVIIQMLFTPITIRGVYTKYLIDEVGMGLAISMSIIAFLCWKSYVRKPRFISLISQGH